MKRTGMSLLVQVKRIDILEAVHAWHIVFFPAPLTDVFYFLIVVEE